jgi:enediyne biosynthesis thioesterase
VRKQYYEYRHVVGLEETDLVGNVYNVNYVRWQGQCREMFILEHAPGVLDELSGDLELRAIESDCEYLADISAFDEVSIRMRLKELSQAQVVLAFDVVRVRDGVEDLAARCQQRVACVRRVNGAATPAPVPPQLASALSAYAIVPATARGSGTGGRA